MGEIMGTVPIISSFIYIFQYFILYLFITNWYYMRIIKIKGTVPFSVSSRLRMPAVCRFWSGVVSLPYLGGKVSQGKRFGEYLGAFRQ